MVHLDHVNCTLGGSQALKDVSLHVERGEFVFLTGPSGAGKTTLLRVLYGDLKPSSGSAIVAGVDLMRLRASGLPALRRKVGVVFQDFKVLPERTVFENIAIALEVRGVPAVSIDRRVRAVIPRWTWKSVPTRPAASFPAASSSAWPSRAAWWSTRS